MANDSITSDKSITRQLTDKWGKSLIDAGYTVIPNAILLRMQALGLDPTDFAIVMHIASYWWRKEKLPFPSKRSLAEGIGVDVSTIRRRIAALERGGLIRRLPRKDRDGGNKSNIYDLTPLAKAAHPYAKQMLQERAASARRREELLSRKGAPKLRSVK